MDETTDRRLPVVRLGSEKDLRDVQPVRLAVPQDEKLADLRLDLPPAETYESRSHQPGLEALIDVPTIDTDLLEQAWTKDPHFRQNVPWGWFILIGAIVGGGAIWSLTGVTKSSVQAKEILVATESAIDKDARENAEAAELMARIDAATRKFFDATEVESLVRLVRHPERVRPLMDQYYAGKPIPANRIRGVKQLQPLTLNNQANFWVESVELADHRSRNLLIEISDSGEPKIDWETLVCYQPMPWDTFASERPAGISLDFRVYIEPDHFFSHEFADSDQWSCYRLTALDSDETLFGYAKVDTEVGLQISDALSRNRGHKASVILRINIPEELQSRRGVVIEKLLSTRWIYVDPPHSSP